MNRKFLTVMGIAAGIVAIGATLSDAEAGRREHGFHGGWHDGYDRQTERRFHRRNIHGHYGFYGHDNFSQNCHRYLMKAR